MSLFFVQMIFYLECRVWVFCLGNFKRELKLKKRTKMEIFKFLKVQYMIIKISILSDHENMVCSFNFCFEKLNINTSSLRKKFPYSELFWSIFSRIWTEYWEIRQSNSEYRHFLTSAFLLPLTRAHFSNVAKNLHFVINGTIKIVNVSTTWCWYCACSLQLY